MPPDPPRNCAARALHLGQSNLTTLNLMAPALHGVVDRYDLANAVYENDCDECSHSGRASSAPPGVLPTSPCFLVLRGQTILPSIFATALHACLYSTYICDFCVCMYSAMHVQCNHDASADLLHSPLSLSLCHCLLVQVVLAKGTSSS